MMRLRALFAAALALPAFAAAQESAPSLALPLDCDVGRVCVVQNYVDHGGGAPARDYACGLLSYAGHKGTDIRLPDTAAMRHGVAVLAAAPGQVRASRDGMDDVSVKSIGKDAIAGREAGNTVIVVFGDGWEIQYAHLRKGSVRVAQGDTVHTGQPLGLVGLSGDTEFPHLHLEVRRYGQAVDPFVGLSRENDCAAGERPLWNPAALAALRYVPTGVLGAGFAGAPPQAEDGGVDTEHVAAAAADSRALVFWLHLYGVRANDREQLRLFGPGGELLVERDARIARNLAVWLVYAGRPLHAARWPAGNYRGEYTLHREGEPNPVVSVVRELELAP